MSGIPPAFFGLLGTFLGVFISWVMTRRRNRSQLTFDMHREFNNAEFSNARRQADLLLRKHPSKRLDEIEEIEEGYLIWLVIRFYQRLWIAIKYQQIKPQLVPELFGEIFFWWYFIHYKDKLITSSYQSTRDDIEALKTWFDNNSPKYLQSCWIERCLNTKENMDT
ncbi:MAG: hypothetical protein AAF773_00010 [Cyanobacteria bacterium P01_D01_bin.115]